DVAGCKEAEEELREIVDFLKNPKKFLDIGARIPKGILLMGAPGTGKTLLARAVAGEAGVSFFSISGSEFVEMFVGVGASRVRDLFDMAKKTAPAIIFVDEIDAVGRVRGTGVGGGNDEREQTLNQILVELDGFEPNEKVIVMAATNRPDVLDPALLRPGRFDRRVTLDLPDRKDREEILLIHARKKPFAEDVNLILIAERTPGFSGADLYSLMNEAAILAARENRTKVSQFDLIRSIEKVMLGPERKSHILSQKEKELTAFHEAGHAIVASVLPYADPVHKISIISRGRVAGYVLKLPIEDRKLQSKKEFLDDIAVALGGYVVEKTIFGDLTTGPSNDLQVSTALARDMVTKYGMSEKIGPMALEGAGGKPLFGMGVGDKEYSERVGAEIDLEVSNIMNEALKRVEKIIKEYKKVLETIATRLIEVETIEQKEFEEILVANGIVPKKKKDIEHQK
ncbi:MAG TPA: ATP-dependent zinc metalloprotease FtsH, partial [Nitrososphaerales archaeon]